MYGKSRTGHWGWWILRDNCVVTILHLCHQKSNARKNLTTLPEPLQVQLLTGVRLVRILRFFISLCPFGGWLSTNSVFFFRVRLPGRDLPAVASRLSRFYPMRVRISITVPWTVEAIPLLSCCFREDTSFPSLEFDTILINHLCFSCFHLAHCAGCLSTPGYLLLYEAIGLPALILDSPYWS